MASTNLSEKTAAFVRLLFRGAAPNSRLPLGRCACNEPSVRWCTRHGAPLNEARRRSDQLALI